MKVGKGVRLVVVQQGRDTLIKVCPPDLDCSIAAEYRGKLFTARVKLTKADALMLMRACLDVLGGES